MNNQNTNGQAMDTESTEVNNENQSTQDASNFMTKEEAQQLMSQMKNITAHNSALQERVRGMEEKYETSQEKRREVEMPNLEQVLSPPEVSPKMMRLQQGENEADQRDAETRNLIAQATRRQQEETLRMQGELERLKKERAEEVKQRELMEATREVEEVAGNLNIDDCSKKDFVRNVMENYNTKEKKFVFLDKNGIERMDGLQSMGLEKFCKILSEENPQYTYQYTERLKDEQNRYGHYMSGSRGKAGPVSSRSVGETMMDMLLKGADPTR